MGREQTTLKQGERRTATVLFSDMSGFSALSERLDPEEIDSLMSRVFDVFQTVVRRHDGFVEKYIGDAIVAVFGVPTLHEDDATRAVNAAIECARQCVRLELGVSFRTGVHTGLVTTGTRGEFEVVTGHTMTIASCLQESAEPGGVLVSEQTRNECGSEFVFGEHVSVSLKGSDRQIRAFPVLRKQRSVLQFETPFIGREQLSASLLKAYLRHDDSAINGVYLTGETGIGKTRLVAEFLNKIREMPGFDAPILYSRLRRFHSRPFGLVQDVVVRHLRVDDVEDPAEITRRLVSRLGIDETDARLFARAAVSQAPDNEGRLVAALHRILEAIVGGTADRAYAPVLFIDNIHNIDKQSRDFLRYFCRNTDHLPFFILAGRHADAELHDFAKDIDHYEVGKLTPEESHSLLENLRHQPKNAALEQQIVSMADGIPLFLEEYAKYVRQQGGVVTLPPTIQSIFLADVEHYKPDAKGLLKRLSMFDRAFTEEDAQFLTEATGEDEVDVPNLLELFVRDGHLIREKRMYQFVHESFRLTLYDSLLNHNKKIMHGLIADRLMAAGPPGNHRTLRHLLRAERFDDLKGEITKNPEHIGSIEFIPYVDAVIEHIPKDDAEHFKFLFIKLAILFNTGRTEDSEIVLEDLISLAFELKNVEYVGRVYHVLSANFFVSNSYEKALLCGRRAVHYYRIASPSRGAVHNAMLIYANVALQSNKLDLNQSIINDMEDGEDPDVFDAKSDAVVNRLIHIGDYRRALAVLDEHPAEGGGTSGGAWYGQTFHRCAVYLRMFDFDRLRTHALKVVETREQGAQHYAYGYALLGLCAFRNGDTDRVADYLSRAEYFAYQIQNDCTLIEIHRLLAIAYSEAGMKDKAIDIAVAAAKKGMKQAAYMYQFGLVVLLAEICTSRDMLMEARFFLTEGDFIIAANTMINPQELMIYWYLKYAIDDAASPETRHGYLKTAWELLQEEHRRIGDRKLNRAFLESRIYGEIHAEWRRGAATG